MERIAETNLRKVYGVDFDEFIQRAMYQRSTDADGKIVPNKSVDEGGIFVGEDASRSDPEETGFTGQIWKREKSLIRLQQARLMLTNFTWHLRNEGERIAKSQGDAAGKPYRDL